MNDPNRGGTMDVKKRLTIEELKQVNGGTGHRNNPKSEYKVINSSGAAIREAPDESSQSVGTLHTGAQIEAGQEDECNSGGKKWFHIWPQMGNCGGYVLSDDLKKIK